MLKMSGIPTEDQNNNNPIPKFLSDERYDDTYVMSNLFASQLCRPKDISSHNIIHIFCLLLAAHEEDQARQGPWTGQGHAGQ